MIWICLRHQASLETYQISDLTILCRVNGYKKIIKHSARFVRAECCFLFEDVIAALGPVGSGGNSEALFEAVFKVVAGVETTGGGDLCD